MESIATAFAECVRKERQSRELSQEALSLAANMSGRTTYNLESGTRKPSVATIDRFCEVLGLEVVFRPR